MEGDVHAESWTDGDGAKRIKQVITNVTAFGPDLRFADGVGVAALEDGLSSQDDFLLCQRPLQQGQQCEIILRRHTLRVASVQPREHGLQNALIRSHVVSAHFLGMKGKRSIPV